MNDDYGSQNSVRRSLWIADNLYTVSEAMIRINRVTDLADVNTVEPAGSR